MTQRRLLLGLMFLGSSLAFARPAEAQRSGFIIGLGLGAGVVSSSLLPDGGSQMGWAMDFHMGGLIGESLEVYYMLKATILSTDLVGVDNVFSGLSGLGVSYPLNPKFSISGGIGLGMWLELQGDAVAVLVTSEEGFGLFGGGRYLLNESGRWAVGLDITYGKLYDDFNALGVQATIIILSH